MLQTRNRQNPNLVSHLQLQSGLRVFCPSCLNQNRWIREHFFGWQALCALAMIPKILAWADQSHREELPAKQRWGSAQTNAMIAMRPPEGFPYFFIHWDALACCLKLTGREKSVKKPIQENKHKKRARVRCQPSNYDHYNTCILYNTALVVQ